MAQKMPIKQFVEQLVAALNRKDGYIMGARGQNPRTGYLDLSKTAVRSSWKETGYYYQQYKNRKKYSTDKQFNQAVKWRKNCTRVWDCNGMAEGIYELFSGVNIDSKARFNYSQWCSPKGSGMIPVQYRVPGAAVFWSDKKASSIHHVAYLWKPVNANKPDGDWYLIEAAGVLKGVVKSKLNSRKPNFWGLMTKYFDYSESEAQIPTSDDIVTVGLKNGDEGNAVQIMQTNLIRLDYDLGKWGADGDFGDATELAVRKFQTDNKLKETGVWTEECDALIQKLLSEKVDAPVENPKKVKIVGGDCYIRAKSDTSGRQIGVAKANSTYEYAGVTADNGWIKIKVNNTTGWVSGKYGKLVG